MKLQTLIHSLAAVPLSAGYFPSANYRRDTDSCNIPLASSNGGRKVAIVIDSSGSMADNDPNDLRITAGKALNGQLVSSAEASGGKSADQVTIVDFDSYATVVYPLGDPAKADSSFIEIDSNGGTWIADGVAKGVKVLTKSGHGTTKDRSGIVVLTDGEDSDVDALIDEINKAESLGIRVSFGFLAPPDSFREPTLLQAILQTGGTYMSFDQAENIQPWLYLLLGNGITALDKKSSTEQPLLSSITIAKLSGSGDVAFSYSASAGEKLLFTVTSLSEQNLVVKLSHENGDMVAKNSTSGNEPAELSVKTTKGETLKVVVSSAASKDGIFQISVNSSLGISGCNLNNSRPNPPKNESIPTPTPTPTASDVPLVTGGASKITPISLSWPKNEDDVKLVRAVYGIVFFEVPHDGMGISSLIPMVNNGSNRFLVESIGRINLQILSI